MSEKKPLNIGLVGYGFMGRTHTNGYKRVSDFFPDLGHRPVLKAVCGRTEDRTKAFAEQWGYESFETDWRELLKRDDIDAIDICTPNDQHAEVAIAAAEAGKMVLCEKPLARTADESLPMVDAVEKAGVPNTVWYNYRRVPAVTLAKQIIDSGKLGQIFHYRANFLQDWTISSDLPQGGEGLWRLDRRGRRQWCDRRLTRTLHRHRPLAQWQHRRRVRCYRDVHQGARPHRHW